MKYLIKYVLVGIILSFPSILNAADCPDMKKIALISKDLHSLFDEDFCVKEVNRIQINWIINTALPRLMNQSFLGVQPPNNWREITDEIVLDCYSTGNLCNKTIQDQFSQCAMAKFPVILFQLGPWMGENCIKMNQAVIERWQDKKLIIKDLIKEYKQSFSRG